MYAFILAIEDDRQREYMTDLVEQYKSRMYNFAYKYLRNRQDAEDAVQEAFIKIFRNIDDYIDHSVDDVGLQVFYCTKSSVIDYYRKRKRKRDIPLVYSMRASAATPWKKGRWKPAWTPVSRPSSWATITTITGSSATAASALSLV